ncbi:hypothetical protein BGZ76_011294 [Entomortierella beljakovae]|nr:hypothetical protein BGZ76_011294 [Entomortierella beljakovae]
MGNQNSKRNGSSKANRNSTILDPNVHPLNNSNSKTNSAVKEKKRNSIQSNPILTKLANSLDNDKNTTTNNNNNNSNSNNNTTNNNNTNSNISNNINGRPRNSMDHDRASKEISRSSFNDSSPPSTVTPKKKRESKSIPPVQDTLLKQDSTLSNGASAASSTTRGSNEIGTLPQPPAQDQVLARYSPDMTPQTTNENQSVQSGTDPSPHSQQTQRSDQSDSPNLKSHDTPPRQPSPQDQSQSNNSASPQQQDQQPSPQHPVPSIPFAVSTPGNPILMKKHNLAPLNITPVHQSSMTNRSSPPSLSPMFGGHKKSSDLSPTARISFLGGQSAGDKGNKGMDIDDIISRLLDAGYSGKISKGICLKNSEILYVCQTAREIFLSQPTLIELSPPVKIVGDIHGQYTDLLRLFEMCGFPPSANFLFLGDYVDRGKMSLETILLLFCYKIKYPENFFLLRGNHECANVTRVYGFYDECKRRASIKMWKAFVDVFNCLPLAAIVANKIFCVHGGLSPNLGTMDDIRALRRPTDVPDYGLLNDLLWSDPSEAALDWEDNERGVSYCFGKSIIQNFLNRHDFDLVCRAHMVVEDGYEFFNDRTLVTVFSAPNYCGEFDNYGAVMSVNEDLLCSFELLKPIDQATARAQMQSLAASAGGWRVNKQRLSTLFFFSREVV